MPTRLENLEAEYHRRAKELAEHLRLVARSVQDPDTVASSINGEWLPAVAAGMAQLGQFAELVRVERNRPATDDA